MKKQGHQSLIARGSIDNYWNQLVPGKQASKLVLDALIGALQLEIDQFGIKVVIIEPGLIDTRVETIEEKSMPEAQRDPTWAPMMKKVEGSWKEGFKRTSQEDVVAETIPKALNASAPKARYRCGHPAESAVIQRMLATY